jgi:hypothetical protein
LRFRTGSGFAFTGLDICSTTLGVVFGIDLCQDFVGDMPRVEFMLLKKSLEIGNAPAATGACSAAFTELAGDARFVPGQVIDHLPFTHMEAVTDFIIKFHQDFL